MKIKDIKTFVVGNKSIHRGGPYWVFVRVTTDTGIKGYGEIYGVAFHPKALLPMIDDLFERHFVGADPFKIERHFRHVYSAGFSQRPDPTVMGIFSGIEIALWDIIGKALEKPVYELLGGAVTERLRSYTYTPPRKNLHCEFETKSIFTDSIFLRYFYIIIHDSMGIRRPYTELIFLCTDIHSIPRCLYYEHIDSLVLKFWIALRYYHVQRRTATIGNPVFGPIQ